MSDKLRVYELAKELGVSSKTILNVLSRAGLPVKNHMSTLQPEVARIAREAIAGREAREAELQPHPSQVPAQAQQSTRSQPRPPQVQPARPQARASQAQQPSWPQTRSSQVQQSRPQARPSQVQPPRLQGRVAQAQQVTRPQARSTQVQQRQSHARSPQAQQARPSQVQSSRPQTRAEQAAQVPGRPRQGQPARPQSQPQAGQQAKAGQGQVTQKVAPKRSITIEGSITVKELAEKTGVPVPELIRKLMSLGVMATINQTLDSDTAAVVVSELGLDVIQKEPELSLEEKLRQELNTPDPPEKLKPRPPVVTVMGHVDHGKTSLLDAICQTHVTAEEAGGITQHIGASTVEVKGKKVVFLDTPGHEAFTAMRARGVKATDIVVLVVAADDGVMPQTVEAINHAKAAKIPIIVAINKMDKPTAKPDVVKGQLAELGLVPEDWGGDVICVPVSARQKTNIGQLLEMILLVAEMLELKANPDKKANGVVLEARLDKGRGPVASVLVQGGTLNVGDAIVCGGAYGRVRAMIDDKGRRIKRAYPSVPVEVVGLNTVPAAGDILQVVDSERVAKDVAEARAKKQREEYFQAFHRMSLEELVNKAKEGQVTELNVIVKADVQGSIDAVKQALGKLDVAGAKVSVIHAAVGGITENDVMLAAASNAIVVGFNVRPDANAMKTAEREHVEIRTYKIIYELVDDIESAAKGLIKPKKREVIQGRAQVRAVFRVPKVGAVAGCYVMDGKIVKDSNVRLIRDGIVVYDGSIASLKRFKEDVKEVTSGYECGVGLDRFQDVKEGDVLEVYSEEEVQSA